MGTPEEDWEGFLKWGAFVREALSCLNKRSYEWLFLPGKGGFYDQDPFIMAIWNCIRDCYIKMVNDSEVQNMIKARSK